MQTKKRYWLRGLTIGLVLTLFGILYLLSITYCIGDVQPQNGFQGKCPQGIEAIVKNFSSLFNHSPIIIYTLVAILVGGALIGAAIGWLCGKFKNRATLTNKI